MRAVLFRIFTLGLLLGSITGTAFSQMGDGMGPGGGHGHDLDNFPGWQGYEIEHNIVLPHLAIGDQVTMTLIFTNMGGPGSMGWFETEEDYSITGTVRFFAEDGDPLPVRIDGVEGAEFPLSLSASEVSYLEVSAPPGSPLRSGWLLLEVDDAETADWGFMDGHAIARGERIMATAYYSILDNNGQLASQVAVRPAIFSQGFFDHHTLPVQFRTTDSGVVRTGFAVVNTSGQDAMVTARLIDDQGQQFGDPQVMSLVAGGQKAQFVEALFPSIPDGFTGTLELSTATEGVISMGLLQTGLVTTSLPSRHYGAWSQSQ